MANQISQASILVADHNAFARRLVAEVLRGLGAATIFYAGDGEELLNKTVTHQPRVVVVQSRLPRVSGLDFTRTVRAGHEKVGRALSIIVMTSTPTANFVKIAQEAGVDEMLAVPFTPNALNARILAVLKRQRRFINSERYVGPDRRRRPLDLAGVPRRRQADAIGGPVPAWETRIGREMMLRQIKRFSVAARKLKLADPQSLHALIEAVSAVRMLAESLDDDMMALASKSLARYVAIGASRGALVDKVLQTHIDAMLTLARLTRVEAALRHQVADDLVVMVDKSLHRAARRA